MNKNNQFLTTSVAILIGSVMISVSILISGGIIKLKKTAQTPTESSIPTQSYKDKLTSAAKELNLDADKFKSCLESDVNSEEINNDIQDAETAGINGTPGFIIGKSSNDGSIRGLKIGGAYPFGVFKTVFDQLEINTPLENISQIVIDKNFANATEADKGGIKEGMVVAQTSSDDDPVLGQEGAKITIVEFSDYECPFCKRHFTQTLPSLRRDYFDNGKVKLVYRDFIAVPSHNPKATEAALAANCAREQGGDEAYFKYHDLVFTKTKANGEGI